MINQFTSDRGEPAAGALEVDGAQGHAVQILTPAETAQVSGGFCLLYWLLLQDAY